MLLETTKKTYRQCFPANANPYISEGFLSLNEHKADKIIRLMKDDDPTIGLAERSRCIPQTRVLRFALHHHETTGIP